MTLDVTVFDQSTHTAADAAAALGAELGQIVKSLGLVAPGTDGELEPIVCLVSGANRVDLARLAASSPASATCGEATAREADELTGFTIGGIPPFGHRATRVIMDPDLGRFQVVWAAAGLPTAVFPVPPGTLRTLANAIVAPITEAPQPADDGSGPQARGASPPGGHLDDGRPTPQNAGV